MVWGAGLWMRRVVPPVAPAVSGPPDGSAPRSIAIAYEYRPGGESGGPDPIRAALAVPLTFEGEPLGFAPTDSFDLTRQFRDPGTGAEHAVVRAVHGDEVYELQLVQPVRQGEDGIWIVEAVQPAH